MKPNPFLIFTLIPAKARVWVYAVGALGLFAWGIWEASHGDIKTFFVSLATSAVMAMAGSNVNPQDPPEAK